VLLEVVSKELALILERYLERDLEALVAEAIPVLAIDQVIVDRVKSTSAEELELATRIVKNELCDRQFRRSLWWDCCKRYCYCCADLG